jgi:hypothetical protein
MEGKLMNNRETIETLLKMVNWDKLLKTDLLINELIDEFPDSVDWDIISQKYHVTLSFIDKFSDKINWKLLSKNTSLDEDTISKYQDMLNWRSIIKNNMGNIKFIIKFGNRQEVKKSARRIIDFLYSSNSPEEDIEKAIKIFINDINLDKLSQNVTLPIGILRMYPEKINWRWAAWNHLLTEDAILEFASILYKLKIDIGIENVTDDMLRELPDIIDFSRVLKFRLVPEDILELFISIHDLSEDDWKLISFTQALSEGFIRKYRGKINWDELLSFSSKTVLSVKFIKELIPEFDTLCLDLIEMKIQEYYINDIITVKENHDICALIEYERSVRDWNYISSKKVLTEEFIRSNCDKVNWELISKFQKLSPEFIDEFADNLNWVVMSETQKLPEWLIDKYANKVNWIKLCIHQKMTENFIDKHREDVNWKFICEHQKLSEDFIDKFRDRVRWDIIFNCQILSEEFISNHSAQFDRYYK